VIIDLLVVMVGLCLSQRVLVEVEGSLGVVVAFILDPEAFDAASECALDVGAERLVAFEQRDCLRPLA
jgi:hypothetical protein